MSLVIAWRNPRPLARTERKVRRVAEDQFGTVYLVTEPDATQETFELYPGGGTKSDELRRVVVESGSTLLHATGTRREGLAARLNNKPLLGPDALGRSSASDRV